MLNLSVGGDGLVVSAPTYIVGALVRSFVDPVSTQHFSVTSPLSCHNKRQKGHNYNKKL